MLLAAGLLTQRCDGVFAAAWANVIAIPKLGETPTDVFRSQQTKQGNMKLKNPRLQIIVALPAVLLLAASVQAQIGTGWSQITPTERLEYETNDILISITPPPSSLNNGKCEYDNTSGTETFQLLNTGSNRVEIRPNDDYSSGTRQFEADVLISSPSANESIHQIFNGPTGPWLIVREQTNNGGSIRMGGGTSSGILASNLYGNWFRLNSINNMNNNQCYIYVNGNLVWQGTNPGGTFYTKYGCYGTLGAASAKIQFKNVKLFSGGTTNQLSLTGTYELQNEASGLVLNNQGSTTNGSAITQWAQGSSVNLKWTFIPTSGGYYQINSVKSGKDAVVQGASTANGAKIIQWSFGSSGNDQWQPVQNSDGSLTFYNLHSGLVLEDPGSSMSNTTQMDQWSSTGGSNQKWKLINE